MKKIENYIQKAKDWTKAILQEGRSNLDLSESESIGFDDVSNKAYEFWREVEIKSFDQKRSWKTLERKIKNTKKTPKVIQLARSWKSVAAILVIGLLGAEGYLIFQDIKNENQGSILSGVSIAYLEIDNNKRIELSSVDTLLLFDEAKAKVDSGKIVYASSEGERELNEYHKINVPRQGEFYVELSDGTKVWINSESSLGFKSKFSDKARFVDLEGEAYFEVAKDATKPFIVRTSNMDVRVLGTEFNVKSYQNDDYTYATLNEGKIRIMAGVQKQDLSPNQQLVFDNATGDMEKREVDASIYSAWVKGTFVFKDERLEDILQTFSRWYDVEVFFLNKGVKDEEFSMSVNRYEDLDVLLRKMEKTGAMTFELNKRALIVK